MWGLSVLSGMWWLIEVDMVDYIVGWDFIIILLGRVRGCGAWWLI
jgi:hypothetical protein